ncbi:unnamed protein product [Brassica oleracea var. botrytis]
MVAALERGLSASKSFNFKRMYDSPSTKQQQSQTLVLENGDSHFVESNTPESQNSDSLAESPVESIPPMISPLTRPGKRPDRQQACSIADTDMMKDRFAKLLLGEDMSGGGKGVSSALALSNAITNLAASIFGEQTKLQPMPQDRQARWKKEIDWLLSVTDHIVEFVPSQQTSKDGVCTEIMVTRQRGDLLMNIPALRKLDTMLINGRASLGDSIYKSITEEWFDPAPFLSMMDLSTEHKVLDLKNKIEASVVIWKRKLHVKDSKSSWGSAVSLEKRELFEERAETILVFLKQKFPGLPQSSLDISKIQFNKDIGQAVLESYSRILESLAYTVMSRIEDVLYTDSLALKQALLAEETSDGGRTETDSESPGSSNSGEETEKLDRQHSKTLFDFMGWSDKPTTPPSVTPKKLSYLEKLENFNGFRSPKDRNLS